MAEITSSTETDGVIKFDLHHEAGPPPDRELLNDVLAWRTVLFRLRLTGRDPERYGGVAYGNMSRRLAGQRFIVSGTQTGGREWLTPADFCLIEAFDLAGNRVWAVGPISPSSESLTHAAIYQANPDCRSVIHVHSPEMWRKFKQHALPATSESIPYGTPAMAHAVGGLVQTRPSGTIAMLGHEDGIISYGPSTEAAALDLLRHLAQSFLPAMAETSSTGKSRQGV